MSRRKNPPIALFDSLLQRTSARKELSSCHGQDSLSDAEGHKSQRSTLETLGMTPPDDNGILFRLSSAGSALSHAENGFTSRRVTESGGPGWCSYNSDWSLIVSTC